MATKRIIATTGHQDLDSMGHTTAGDVGTNVVWVDYNDAKPNAEISAALKQCAAKLDQVQP